MSKCHPLTISEDASAAGSLEIQSEFTKKESLSVLNQKGEKNTMRRESPSSVLTSIAYD